MTEERDFDEPQRSRMLAWYEGFEALIQGDPGLYPLFLLIEHEEPTTLLEWRDYHKKVREAVHQETNFWLRYAYIRGINQFAGQPHYANYFDDKIGDPIRSLRGRGYARVGRLQPEVIGQMLEYFEATPGVDSDEYFTWLVPQAMLAPGLMAIANDPIILSIVERYLGATPIILDYSAWHSKAHGGKPTKAQKMHRDADDLRFLKLFIYLTDVKDKNCGPFVFVRESHRFDIIDKAEERWSGPPEFGTWYYSTLRKKDADVARVFGRNKFDQILGNAGTAFLADTSGMHRGTLPVKKDRILAQVLYGVTPSARTYDVPVVTCPPLEGPQMYTNMLFAE